MRLSIPLHCDRSVLTSISERVDGIAEIHYFSRFTLKTNQELTVPPVPYEILPRGINLWISGNILKCCACKSVGAIAGMAIDLLNHFLWYACYANFVIESATHSASSSNL
jgi:hypothetical protein